jgi:hypothetical protein
MKYRLFAKHDTSVQTPVLMIYKRPESALNFSGIRNLLLMCE